MNTSTPAHSAFAAFELSRDPRGRLVCTMPNGTAHVGVVPVRAFPITAPGEGISLVGCDGHELLWFDRLERLPEPARALIEAELAEREFMPPLQRLVSVSTFSTPSVWQVDTDRGPTRFELKGEEDIRRLPGDRARLMITSADGLHFIIDDLHALDRHSRRLIERFL